MSKLQSDIIVFCCIMLTIFSMFFIKISLAKLERIVQFAERTEIRFNTFADAVQPVVTSAGKKTVEAISNIDASEVAEKGNEIIEEASDRAKRWLNKDRE